MTLKDITATGITRGRDETHANSKRVVYTIGHSNQELDDFVVLLKQNGVNVLADVRSRPYSRLEHFRRDVLERTLESEGIQYLFLGRELGARREEPECYLDGQAVYDRVAHLPAFRDGLQRLELTAIDHVVAMMCAEREPLDCHRTVLVARQLAERHWCVLHILADGRIEDHSTTERRMIEAMGMDPLFDGNLTERELIQRAYEERGREIAYRADEEEHV